MSPTPLLIERFGDRWSAALIAAAALAMITSGPARAEKYGGDQQSSVQIASRGPATDPARFAFMTSQMARTILRRRLAPVANASPVADHRPDFAVLFAPERVISAVSGPGPEQMVAAPFARPSTVASAATAAAPAVTIGPEAIVASGDARVADQPVQHWSQVLPELRLPTTAPAIDVARVAVSFVATGALSEAIRVPVLSIVEDAPADTRAADPTVGAHPGSIANSSGAGAKPVRKTAEPNEAGKPRRSSARATRPATTEAPANPLGWARSLDSTNSN